MEKIYIYKRKRHPTASFFYGSRQQNMRKKQKKKKKKKKKREGFLVKNCDLGRSKGPISNLILEM
jgi:hypothetical protein